MTRLAAAPAPLATADTLADLARRVERLRPSHRDPEAFHLEKSDIADALRQLAAGPSRPARPRVGKPRRFTLG